MDSREKRFVTGKGVEARFPSNSIKSALKVYSKFDDELVMTFTPGSFSMHVESREKGKMFYSEIFGANIPIYNYNLAYTDGTIVDRYTITLSASKMLKLPIFKGSSKKIILHFYFTVNHRGKVVEELLYFPNEGQASKTVPMSRSTERNFPKEEFTKYYIDRNPNSKCISDIFLQLTATSTNDEIRTFEFGLLSNDKILIFTKDYSESIERRKEQAEEKKSTKKSKKEKFWLSVEPLDKDSSLPSTDKEEGQEPDMGYAITISKRESDFFNILCKLNPMSTIQFFLMKGCPLAIRFPLEDIGYATFLYSDIEIDKLEVTPKRRPRKKANDSSSSD